MSFVNDQSYVSRRTTRATGRLGKIRSVRNWFLVKHRCEVRNGTGVVSLGGVSFPQELIGKRVRFKVEVIE